MSESSLAGPDLEPRPPWLTVRVRASASYQRLRSVARGHHLHTVCEEARCPNLPECWDLGTATFLLLGDTCTRACGFCAVTSGHPSTVDPSEPLRVAMAVRALGLRHAVLTSVTRDDLPDGGAGVFADSIRSIRALCPGCSVEVLVPDFLGDWAALGKVISVRPEVLNHNLESVPRLYRRVRPKAVYERSLELLRRSKDLAPSLVTKSGLMVGLGETRDELLSVFDDLRANGVAVLTVGQYLRPSARHLPVVRYYPPADFVELREHALARGFSHVESGPLVRSSYHARLHLGPD